MTQGVLPFKYEEEKKSTDLTSLAGLPLYLDLAYVSGLFDSLKRRLTVRTSGQGWSDTEIATSLILLNLAGGSCVNDLEILKADQGFNRVLRRVKNHWMSRKERRLKKSKEEVCEVPSPSTVFRFLSCFHDQGEETKRRPGFAFIPAPNEHLKALAEVNRDFVSFVQRRSPEAGATLDMDATLIETNKREALYGYKGYKAYQPMNVYWAEQELVLRSEFRDGNVPANHELLRVFKESLEVLPDGVEKVYLRSDSAGYQHDLLKYCAEGQSERFGVIEFAVGADVTKSFKEAVASVVEGDWHILYREVDGKLYDTGQEWAEVCYVPNWVGLSKKSPDYRYLAIREQIRQMEFPGMEQLEFPFPVMEFGNTGRYKVFGLVTNRTVPGEEVIWWFRKRCGKSEEAHSVMKEDLCGGKLPSGEFGENAAWWGFMVLAFNLNSAMKRLVLGANWLNKRLKAIRFCLINLAGRVVKRSGELIVRLLCGHPSNGVLFEARRKLLCMACTSSG